MLRSNKKSGFALIEVICALGILCMSSAYIYNVKVKCIQLKRYNENSKKYIELSENSKNIFESNYSYEELQDIFKSKSNGSNNLYIKKDNLNINSLKNFSLENIVSSIKPYNLPYEEILLTYEEEGVMKVTINLNFKNRNKIEKLNTCFYKGDY